MNNIYTYNQAGIIARLYSPFKPLQIMQKVKLSSWDTFFIRFAGHSPQTVEATTPSEKSRIVTMGLVLFIPVLMGGVSGGYAATFLSSSPWAWTFGIIWAVVVYLIDRAIISINNGGFWVYLTRFVMAIVIGLVISFPFKIRIFEDVIAEQQFEQTQLKSTNIENRYQKKINQKQNRLDAEKAQLNHLYDDFKVEMDGSGGTGNRGYGTIATRKEQEYLAAKAAYTKDSANFALEKSLITMEMQNELTQMTDVESNGLIGKYKALGKVAAKEPFVNTVSYLLWFFFTLLELIPLLVKIMNSKGLYNRVVETEDEARMVANQNIYELRIQAESIAAAVPNENKINQAKLQIAQEKVDAETTMAKMYAAETMKLWKEERKHFTELSKAKIDVERFDKLADQVGEIFDKSSDNIFNLAQRASPEGVL